MAKKKKDSYWQERQDQLNEALEKDEKALKKRLTNYYKAEERRLEKEIASYYTNYGVDNVVEYRQLLQRLPESDRQLLMQRMDDFAQKHPDYAHLMPVRESIYRLDRLEGLEYSVEMQQLEMGIKTEAEVEKHLLKQGERAYRYTREDLGFGRTFNAEDREIIRNVVHTRWAEGKNFSERIWGNTDKITNRLNNDIASGFARGDGYSKMVRQIRQDFKVQRNDAYRLIYTEGTFVMNESRAKGVEGVFDYYQLSCLPGACDKCVEVAAEQEAEPTRFQDRISGDNFPPIHPWCRCSFIIVAPDPQQWIDDYVAEHGGDPELDEETREAARKVLDKFTDSGKINVPDISKCRYGTPEEYKALRKEHNKLVDKDTQAQIAKHTKPDGSPGGYVATHNYSNINSNLRNDGYTGNQLDEDDWKTINAIRQATEKCQMKGDRTLTRYVNADYLTHVFGLKSKSGEILTNNNLDPMVRGYNHMALDEARKAIEGKMGVTYTEEGITSASYMKDKNIMSKKPVRITYSVVDGTNCYLPKNAKESEVLFADKTVVFWDSVHESIDGKLEIFATVLGRGVQP